MLTSKQTKNYKKICSNITTSLFLIKHDFLISIMEQRKKDPLGEGVHISLKKTVFVWVFDKKTEKKTKLTRMLPSKAKQRERERSL